MRLTARTDLFLVDAPLRYDQAFQRPHESRRGPTLHFTYSRNYGGILLPPPSGTSLCHLFAALAVIFGHRWQVIYIFESDGAFANVPFLYLMSHSLWESNRRDLDRQIRHVSFRSIRNPNLQISDSLHDMREDLAILHDNLAKTIWYVRPDVKAYFENLAKVSADVASRRNPLQRLPDILAQTEKLHDFFIETFQLLVNTIVVRDSQNSLKQAEQALLQTKESLEQTRQSIFLSRLAAVYLPLSVATGVFGMNLREINGAMPRAWAFVVVLLGLLLLTAGPFYFGNQRAILKSGLERKLQNNRAEDNFVYKG